MTQPIGVLHYIGGQLDAGKQIDIIYLDMSKAFDKVDHTNLLGICTNTVLLPNSTTGSVHSYRDASKRLQFLELFPENCSDKQVSEQCAKANKLLGFVRRVSRYIQSTQTRRTLYLSIVRCLLGYATQVWSPQSIGLLKRVENMQRRYEIYISTFIFHTRVLHMECSSRRATLKSHLSKKFVTSILQKGFELVRHWRH